MTEKCLIHGKKLKYYNEVDNKLLCVACKKDNEESQDDILNVHDVASACLSEISKLIRKLGKLSHNAQLKRGFKVDLIAFEKAFKEKLEDPIIISNFKQEIMPSLDIAISDIAKRLNKDTNLNSIDFAKLLLEDAEQVKEEIANCIDEKDHEYLFSKIPFQLSNLKSLVNELKKKKNLSEIMNKESNLPIEMLEFNFSFVIEKIRQFMAMSIQSLSFLGMFEFDKYNKKVDLDELEDKICEKEGGKREKKIEERRESSEKKEFKEPNRKNSNASFVDDDESDGDSSFRVSSGDESEEDFVSERSERPIEIEIDPHAGEMFKNRLKKRDAPESSIEEEKVEKKKSKTSGKSKKLNLEDNTREKNAEKSKETGNEKVNETSKDIEIVVDKDFEKEKEKENENEIEIEIEKEKEHENENEKMIDKEKENQNQNEYKKKKSKEKKIETESVFESEKNEKQHQASEGKSKGSSKEKSPVEPDHIKELRTKFSGIKSDEQNKLDNELSVKIKEIFQSKIPITDKENKIRNLLIEDIRKLSFNFSEDKEENGLQILLASRILEKITAIPKLEFNGMIGASQVQDLIKVIKKIQIQKVKFVNTNIAGFLELGEMTRNEELFGIGFFNCNLNLNDPANLKNLTVMLNENSKLKYFKINGCNIDDENVSAINEGLKTNQHLDKLNLNENKLTIKGIREMFKSISKNEVLSFLVIRNNFVKSEELSELETYLDERTKDLSLLID